MFPLSHPFHKHTDPGTRVREALILFVAGGCLLLLSLPGCRGRNPQAVFHTPDGPKRVVLEVADTEEARSRGLMFRTSLQEDHGMLFVFETEGEHAFWMKNTYLSLDILFLSNKGDIVDLYHRLPPCPLDPCPSYAPRAPARYALEVPAGFSERHHIRKGDRVRLEFKD